mmetsp:Transcript_772/g.1187  ORF Transcript_772/g.1187 Transcript_772/m.1187 type:complete len:345 (+) Transcript_772:28-1062(+)
MADSAVDLKKLRFFLTGALSCLPSHYANQEQNRLMLLYFVLGSKDLTNTLPEVEEEKKAIIDWVYSQQLIPDKDDSSLNDEFCGFRGSPFTGNPWNPECNPTNALKHDYSHITHTYTALAVLKMLGDDYSRVNREAVIRSVKRLQNENGSFNCLASGSESDMRFVYCAACICHLLNDWNGMDVELTANYIASCQNYDGAMGQAPGQESNGGGTYCAIASLQLMGKLDEIPDRELLLHWLMDRQISGFQGRPNKVADTCYSWWIGASLQILGHFDLVSEDICRGFHFQCQANIGGFSKVPGVHPDVLHTYFSLAALQMLGDDSLQHINYPIGITRRACQVKSIFD